MVPKIRTGLGNRESWLTEVGKQVESFFAGFTIAPYRVTCGWPCKGGVSLRRRVVGECHGIKYSKGGVHEIFISPTLDEPLDVAGTLCHELAHAVAGIDAQHSGKFVTICKHVGLTKGKPRSVMPGPRLVEKLKKILIVQGPYPHQALQPVAKVLTHPPSMVKLECPTCGCIVMISMKWLDTVGEPTCGCGTLMEVSV